MIVSLSSGISNWLFEIDLDRRVVASLLAAADQTGAFSFWCDREGGRTRQRIVLKTDLISAQALLTKWISKSAEA